MLKDTEYKIDKDGWSFDQLSLAFEEAFRNFEKTGNSEKNGAQLEGFKTFNLTKRNALHILAYTGYSAQWINSYILEERALEKNESAEQFIENLDNSLALLPQLNNCNFVYRMEFRRSVNDAYNEFALKVNSIMHIQQYLSTDKEEYPNCDVIWKIRPLHSTSRGKDLTTITNNGTENEVLFQRETKLFIESIDKRGGKLYINMREIQ